MAALRARSFCVRSSSRSAWRSLASACSTSASALATPAPGLVDARLEQRVVEPGEHRALLDGEP